MNAKNDMNTRQAPEDAVESVGDATMISWSLFESLEELRQAPAVPETGEPPAANGQTHPAALENSDNLQAVLDKYNDWLRRFKS